MKTNLLSLSLCVGLFMIIVHMVALPANAQWVQKVDALKKRSEVTSVVYNNKLYRFIGFGNSSLNVEPTRRCTTR